MTLSHLRIYVANITSNHIPIAQRTPIKLRVIRERDIGHEVEAVAVPLSSKSFSRSAPESSSFLFKALKNTFIYVSLTIIILLVMIVSLSRKSSLPATSVESRLSFHPPGLSPSLGLAESHHASMAPLIRIFSPRGVLSLLLKSSFGFLEKLARSLRSIQRKILGR